MAKTQKMNCGGKTKKMADGGSIPPAPGPIYAPRPVARPVRAPIATDRKVGVQPMKKGGQAKASTCRGMGAATKGGKFSRNG